MIELLGPGTLVWWKRGGLFGGTRMWAAVLNRDVELCAFATSTAVTQAPGARAKLGCAVLTIDGGDGGREPFWSS